MTENLVKGTESPRSSWQSYELYLIINRNLDTNLYIEILMFRLLEINKIMKNLVILLFDKIRDTDN